LHGVVFRFLFWAVTRLPSDYVALDRYERRALSLFKFAICELDAVRGANNFLANTKTSSLGKSHNIDNFGKTNQIDTVSSHSVAF
jgi:hypothetical protein